MKRWEYRIWVVPTPNTMHEEVIDALNELGADGWEVIAVNVPMFWLKREIT